LLNVHLGGLVLTVRELTELPVVGTRLIAGDTGGSRAIRSAHVCEIDEPWRWLSQGDLMLSTGSGFPVRPTAQVTLVERLDASGMAGLAVADGPGVPHLSDELRRAADRLGFPVLRTEWDVPFSALSRLIADNAHSEVRVRLERVLNVYERYRVAIARSPEVAGLVDDVSAQLGIPFELIEIATGRRLLTAKKTDYSHACALREALRPRDGSSFRSMRRVDLDGCECFAVPISSDGRAALLVRLDEPGLDLVSLQHLSTLLAVEVSRFCDTKENSRRDVAGLLRRLLEQTVDVEHARQLLAEHQLGQPPWRIAAVADDLAPQLITALDCAGVPHATLTCSDGVVLLLTMDSDLDTTCQHGEPSIRLAVSKPFWSLSSFAAAAKEAKWVRWTGAVGSSAVGTLDYSSAPGTQDSSFLPNSVAEAQALVSSILGCLIEYDRDHGSELVRSLETFLSVNRSWQQASSQLSVHRQTLQYRLSRVREITGRRLDNIDDLTQVHMALKILRMLEGTGGPTTPATAAMDDHRRPQLA
jgi:PucR family transcriptional regulator, purine catabolism regulatory protein